MKIASWNVNSLRVRLPHVLQWLDQARPDVLALQGEPVHLREALLRAGERRYMDVPAGRPTRDGSE